MCAEIAAGLLGQRAVGIVLKNHTEDAVLIDELLAGARVRLPVFAGDAEERVGPGASRVGFVPLTVMGSAAELRCLRDGHAVTIANTAVATGAGSSC